MEKIENKQANLGLAPTSQVFDFKGKSRELGASLVEYGLLVALVALIAIPSVSAVGDKLNGQFEVTRDVLASGGVQEQPD